MGDENTRVVQPARGSLPPGEAYCSRCGKRSEIAAKQEDGLCLSCIIDISIEKVEAQL
jgi:hypothetical protein